MAQDHPVDDTLEIPFLDYCAIHRPAPANGKCIAWVEPRPEFMNSMHMAHGGLLMTLMDAAMGGASRSLQPQGVTVVTVDMQVSFMGPARGRVEARGRVVKATRSLVFAECEVFGGDGELAARATGLFRPVDRLRMSGQGQDKGKH
jgi:uncharacterized protein (TIGR00369 family)